MAFIPWEEWDRRQQEQEDKFLECIRRIGRYLGVKGIDKFRDIILADPTTTPEQKAAAFELRMDEVGNIPFLQWIKEELGADVAKKVENTCYNDFYPLKTKRLPYFKSLPLRDTVVQARPGSQWPCSDPAFQIGGPNGVLQRSPHFIVTGLPENPRVTTGFIMEDRFERCQWDPFVVVAPVLPPLELPGDIEAIIEFLEALAKSKRVKPYKRHIQKLNVSAGDHCLETEQIEGDDIVPITSMCAVADGCSVDLIEIGYAYLNNYFWQEKKANTVDGQTVCARGLYPLVRGYRIRACFTNVPSGCDLHLYVNGYWSSVGAVGTPVVSASLFTPPEEVPIGIWSSDVFADEIYQHNMDATLSVRNTYSSPAGAPQGLTWDGIRIWSCDTLSNKIYKHNMDATLSVLTTYSSPSGSPTGLLWDGSRIWSCDSGLGKIYKHNMDATLSVNTTYNAPGSDTEGIMWDGATIWSCDDDDEEIYKHNMDATLSVDTTYSGPFVNIMGLAWDGSKIWSCDDGGAKIYKRNMDATLSVAATYTSPDIDVRGIAFQM